MSQSYSKPKVGRFLRHCVVVLSRIISTNVSAAAGSADADPRVQQRVLQRTVRYRDAAQGDCWRPLWIHPSRLQRIRRIHRYPQARVIRVEFTPGRRVGSQCCSLPTSLVVTAEQSVQCVCVRIRTITFELSDLWRSYLVYLLIYLLLRLVGNARYVIHRVKSLSCGNSHESVVKCPV